MTTALLLAVLVQAPGSDEEAVQALAKLFTGEPVIQREKNGQPRLIKLVTRSVTGKGSLSMKFEKGRVVAVDGIGVAISNDEFALFKPFTALRQIRLAYNGGPGDSAPYNGAGLTHLQDLPALREIQLPCAPFNDEGLKAVAELTSLAMLNIGRNPVTSEGFAVVAGHPGLESIHIDPYWGACMDKAVEHLSDCPKLAHVKINEAYVTYEGGLRHLVKRKDTLRTIELVVSLIAPEDVERLRAELPGVTITHAGMAAVGKLMLNQGTSRKLSKIAPKALVERYQAAAR